MTARPKWFAHANVNCADLGASERVSVECLDRHPQWRTEPSEVQDGAGFGMPGAPVRWEGAITSGLSYQRASFQGVDGIPHPAVFTRDPGGTAVELIGGAAATTYTGVRVNCANLDRSVEWYTLALGLDSTPEREGDLVDDVGGIVGRFRAVDMFVPHRRRSFRLELTEWITPAPIGTPYTTANHAGIYRVALTVDDIDVGYADLLRSVPDAPAPVTVDLGESLGPMRALLFPDPDGSVVELLEQGLW